MFSCEYCKMFKNSFFYRTPSVAVSDYSNQSKIFREITASKFQGQHAEQFNFCRCEVICPAAKTEIHSRFSNGVLRDFRTATFGNIFFGKAASEKKTEEEKDGQRPLWFQTLFKVMKQCSFVSTNFRIAEPFN